MKKEEFRTLILQTIDAKIIELISTKPDEPCVNYTDAQSISLVVKNIFIKPLKICPKEIEAVCSLSEAVLAPTKRDKVILVKRAYGLAGGLTGFAMVISSIGLALGWGASVTASVGTFFAGTAVLGPIGLGLTGLGLTAIAAYFTFSSDSATNHERYIKSLKNGLSGAIDAIWDEHGNDISSGIVLTSSS
jgi:hypothetical protein